MRAHLIVAIAAMPFPGAAAAPPTHQITKPAVRAFVARQEALWNSRDLAGFFALAAPEAVFVTERTGANGRVAVERETAAESRRSAERAFATISRFRESTSIERIEIAADGLSARVFGREQAEVTRGGATLRLCAETEQSLILRAGTILTLGQTDRMRSCGAPVPASAH